MAVAWAEMPRRALAMTALVGLLACLALLSPAPARAALSWSSPTYVDLASGQPLDGLACPSTTQCTAIAQIGEEVTFNPSSPAAQTPAVVDLHGNANAISCPTTNQCTVVDSSGEEATFDPNAPGQPTPTTIDPGQWLKALACPSATLCAAVGDAGDIVTFDPQSQASPTVRSVGASFVAVSCPSGTQCTALASASEVTFDPTSGATPTPVSMAGGGFTAVSCPSTTLCVGAAPASGEVIFNPQSPGTASTFSTRPIGYVGVACVSTTQCTTFDGADELTFDPQSPVLHTPTTISSNGSNGSISCPAATACVTVDNAGQETTFDPTAPSPPSPVTLDSTSTGNFTAVSCPSATQCTAISIAGTETTWNPQAPSAPTQATIDSPADLREITCPSTTECVAVGATSVFVFNPQAPANVSSGTIGGSLSVSVACASTTECVAIDYTHGNAIEFNPQSLGSQSPLGFNAPGVGGVVCPASGECVAVDSTGTVYVFNPASPGSETSTPIGAQLNYPGTYDVACASATQCTIAAPLGNEWTFDPQAPGHPQEVTLVPLADNGLISALDCPAANQCTAMNGDDELTFDPQRSGPATQVLVDPNYSSGLSCPTASQCTSVDPNGAEVTFAPAALSTPPSTTVDGAGPMNMVSCPSLAQCTAVDQSGVEVTFDPTSPSGANEYTLDPGVPLVAVSCPSGSECVAIGQISNVYDDTTFSEYTFDPRSPSDFTKTVLYDEGPGGVFFAPILISCPTLTECSALGQYPGLGWTFNPQAVGQPVLYSLLSFGDSLSLELEGFSCASATLCTGTDSDGRIFSYDPSSTPTSPPPATPLTSWTPYALACPSTSECVADGGTGNGLTFNPLHPAQAISYRTGLSGGLISCPSAFMCAIASTTSNAFAQGDPNGPSSWTSGAIASAGQIVSLSCPAASECVAIDDVGREFTGTQAPPTTPVNSHPPSITGIAQQGQTLTESRGSWSGSPTSYAYQWEHCDATGSACHAITGATGQTYVVAVGDVGGTIRVQETAANAGGAGTPAVSSATAVVQAAPGNPGGVAAHLTLGRATVTGRRASLAFTCSGTTGGSCALTAVLTVVETIKAGKITAVAAFQRGHARAASTRRRVRHKTVVIGVASARLQAGASASAVIVRLNRAGLKLLAARHRFKARLTVLVNGATLATRTLTFHAAKHHKHSGLSIGRPPALSGPISSRKR